MRHKDDLWRAGFRGGSRFFLGEPKLQEFLEVG